MTDYTEEMMKTAGVRVKKICCSSDPLCDSCSNSDEVKLQKEEQHYFADVAYCDYDEYSQVKCRNFRLKKEVYPNFTPKKQIEIIKLIGNSRSYEYIGALIDNNIDYKLSFLQALAKSTIELIKTGELDKEKVKEILERCT